LITGKLVIVSILFDSPTFVSLSTLFGQKKPNKSGSCPWSYCKYYLQTLQTLVRDFYRTKASVNTILMWENWLPVPCLASFQAISLKRRINCVFSHRVFFLYKHSWYLAYGVCVIKLIYSHQKYYY